MDRHGIPFTLLSGTIENRSVTFDTLLLKASLITNPFGETDTVTLGSTSRDESSGGEGMVPPLKSVFHLRA
jgi:hypothetical protein